MNSSSHSTPRTGAKVTRATAFIKTQHWVEGLAAERQRLEASLRELGGCEGISGPCEPEPTLLPESPPIDTREKGMLSVDKLVAIGSELAPAMAIIGRLRHLLHDPKAEMQEVVDIIRLDPALTLKVVQLSNSVLYGARIHHDTIEHAAGRIGFTEIYRMVGLAATYQCCQQDLKTYGLNARQVWQTTVATAAAAEIVAMKSGTDAGLAYTAGLFRTLGRVIIDTATGARSQISSAPNVSVNEWERRTFGLTSAEVTNALLTHWNFPSEIIGAVRGQFAPLADIESNVSAGVLNLACDITTRLGFDLPGETGYWLASPATLTLTGLTEEDLATCTVRAKEHCAALCATVA